MFFFFLQKHGLGLALSTHYTHISLTDCLRLSKLAALISDPAPTPPQKANKTQPLPPPPPPPPPEKEVCAHLGHDTNLDYTTTLLWCFPGAKETPQMVNGAQVLHIKTNLGATLAATSSGLRGVLLAALGPNNFGRKEDPTLAGTWRDWVSSCLLGVATIHRWSFAFRILGAQGLFLSHLEGHFILGPAIRGSNSPFGIRGFRIQDPSLQELLRIAFRE